MKTLNVYSFFDKKAMAFDTPFHCLDNLHAKRHFIMTSRQKKTIIGSFLSDFELYLIGEVDLKKGLMIPEERPVLIMTGNEVIKEDTHNLDE